jgi:hypothetical protein
MEFEIPLLKALINLGGVLYSKFPEEYEDCKSYAVKWKNKTAWARK